MGSRLDGLLPGSLLTRTLGKKAQGVYLFACDVVTLQGTFYAEKPVVIRKAHLLRALLSSV
jgi:hypothetical protein